MNNTAVAAKTQRKQLQRDRATIQAESIKLSNPQSTQADKEKAVATISSTVLKGTGLSTTGSTGKMLGRLTVDLLNSPGTVIGLGIQDAIKLKAPEDAASIPPKVVERLKKLV